MKWAGLSGSPRGRQFLHLAVPQRGLIFELIFELDRALDQRWFDLVTEHEVSGVAHLVGVDITAARASLTLGGMLAAWSQPTMAGWDSAVNADPVFSQVLVAGREGAHAEPVVQSVSGPGKTHISAAVMVT